MKNNSKVLKKFFCLCLFSLSSLTVCAQELEYIDLGVIEGEVKRYQGTIKWVNQFDQRTKIQMESQDLALSVAQTNLNLVPKDTLLINYEIDIEGKVGLQEFALQLRDKEGVLLHGFQLLMQVLAPVKDVFKTYRNEYWPFRTKERYFNLRTGYAGDTLSHTFDVYNFSGSNFDHSVLVSGDSLRFYFEPLNIQHNRFGRMRIQLLSTPDADLGFQRSSVPLMAGADTITYLPVQYTLVPKPHPQDELVSAGPRITSNKVQVDFEEVKKGELLETSINLSNVGNAPLNIKKIESNCDCLTFELSDGEIRSDNSTSLRVQFNTKNRMGLERKTLAIFSNDPQTPTLVLTFKAHVK